MTAGKDGIGTVAAMGCIDEVFVLRGLERSPTARDLPTVDRDGHLFFRGWAAHPSDAVPSRRIAMLVDGNECGIVRGRRRRPDVAAHFASGEMLRVGFLACLDASSIEPGRHEVRFVLNDGESALPPVSIRVGATTAEAQSARSEPSFDVCVDEFSDVPPRPEFAYRIEFGMRALVRGSFSDRLADDAHDVYARIDECDAVPVQRYGARFFTGFATDDLEIGSHVLRFVARVRGDLIWSSPIDFEVIPTCLGRFAPPTGSQIVPASIELREADGREFARGEIAYVSGWAVDDVRRDSASAVVVHFDCGARFAMQMRGERRDVAARLGMPEAAYCGFVGGIATAALPIGRNVGRCVVVSKNRTTVYASDATIELIVRDP